MKIKYDKESDAMYIYLAQDKKSTHTEEIREDLLVDYSGKEMIGIEILAASSKLSKKSLSDAQDKSVVYLSQIGHKR